MAHPRSTSLPELSRSPPLSLSPPAAASKRDDSAAATKGRSAQRYAVARAPPSARLITHHHPVVQLRRCDASEAAPIAAASSTNARADGTIFPAPTLSLFKHNHHNLPLDRLEAVVRDADDIRVAKFELPPAASYARRSGDDIAMASINAARRSNSTELAGVIHLFSPDLGEIKLEVRREPAAVVCVTWRMDGEIAVHWRWQRARVRSDRRHASESALDSTSRAVFAQGAPGLTQKHNGNGNHQLTFALDAATRWAMTFTIGPDQGDADRIGAAEANVKVSAELDHRQLSIYDLAVSPAPQPVSTSSIMRSWRQRDARPSTEQADLDAALFNQIVQLGALWVASHPHEPLLETGYRTAVSGQQPSSDVVPSLSLKGKRKPLHVLTSRLSIGGRKSSSEVSQQSPAAAVPSPARAHRPSGSISGRRSIAQRHIKASTAVPAPGYGNGAEQIELQNRSRIASTNGINVDGTEREGEREARGSGSQPDRTDRTSGMGGVGGETKNSPRSRREPTKEELERGYTRGPTLRSLLLFCLPCIPRTRAAIMTNV